ncbi:MAG: LacI family DNA-binding transcriptional regulator, partial [Burkholderiales bacterium]|nr:LacI family DNA-binding transcriptional regulator [Opitutaceae bacterium]
MNLKQLAAHLKLSPATVSRVLAGKGAEYRIGEETQARVRSAAGKLGVTINQQARGLRLRSTQTLGLIVPDISNPFFAALCRQIELEARTRGYSVLVADSQEQ